MFATSLKSALPIHYMYMIIRTLSCIFCKLVGNSDDLLDVLVAQFTLLTFLLMHTTAMKKGKGLQGDKSSPQPQPCPWLPW